MTQAVVQVTLVAETLVFLEMQPFPAEFDIEDQAASGADEFMFVCDIFDPALRQRSLTIAADVCGQS